ncbi:hypothetical protein RLIN73S_05091 [Rhodanobacter lindaniclasticus]
MPRPARPRPLPRRRRPWSCWTAASTRSSKTTLKAKHPDTSLADLRGSALAVQDQARQLALGLAPQMTALQSQLDVLGPAPAKDAPPEAVEVAAQRRQLDKAMATLDAQTKQAQLLGQNALQLATQITGLRNDEFQARLASRTATPFSRTFWADPLRTLPDDRVRIKRLGARFADAVAQAWQPPNRQPLVWCLIAAALLLGGGRRILERLLLTLATHRVPDGHLRRSAMAAAVALTAVLTTGLAAQLAYLGLDWNGILDDDLAALVSGAVGLVYFAAYLTGLGRALLSVLATVLAAADTVQPTAQRLRPFPRDRLRLLTRWLARRLRGNPVHPAIACALQRLAERPQVQRIAPLVREAGLSERRFGMLFQRQVGMRPKHYARLLRFRAVVDHAQARPTVNWSQEVAADGGDSDQAHLTHEFRQFAGITPAAFMAVRGPYSNHLPLD